MSLIDLELVKQDLRVTNDDDDTLIQVLLDAAEDEALQFLGTSELPYVMTQYSSETIAPSVYAAVFLLVRAKYDETNPEQIGHFRRAAETLLMPYRESIGL